MREREGLIARIRQIRRMSAEADEQARPSTSGPRRDELRALEARIAHLEELVLYQAQDRGRWSSEASEGLELQGFERRGWMAVSGLK